MGVFFAFFKSERENGKFVSQSNHIDVVKEKEEEERMAYLSLDGCTIDRSTDHHFIPILPSLMQEMYRSKQERKNNCIGISKPNENGTNSTALFNAIHLLLHPRMYSKH